MKKKKKQFSEPDIVMWPQVSKGTDFFGREVLSQTRHGRAFGRPFLAQGANINSPQQIDAFVSELRKAGLLVPEHRISGNFSLSSRLGSRRRALRDITLYSYLKRYFQAIKRGLKPPTSNINSCLKSAANSIGIAHAHGFSLYHPHFSNLIVQGRRIGLIDFEFTRKPKIPWDSPQGVFNLLQSDFEHIYRSWRSLRIAVNSWGRRDRPIERMLGRREDAFIHNVISHYPMSPEGKAELESIIRRQFERLRSSGL